MKVVYNACYGGFGLSEEAVLLGRELSDNQEWGGACLVGDVYAGGKVVEKFYGAHCGNLERTDETLVKVVETLGEKANGRFADLRIDEIPDGVEYEIDEYDGQESVVPPRMSW